jgi:hypothetical protein
MIRQLAGGTILSGQIDVYPFLLQGRGCSQDSQVNSLLGLNLSGEEISSHLTMLESLSNQRTVGWRSDSRLLPGVGTWTGRGHDRRWLAFTVSRISFIHASIQVVSRQERREPKSHPTGERTDERLGFLRGDNYVFRIQ